MIVPGKYCLAAIIFAGIIIVRLGLYLTLEAPKYFDINHGN